jgi:hypothetical protein
MRNHLCPTVATALLFTAMNLISPRSPDAANCTNSAEATPSSAWRTITPPKEDVEIVYSGPYGWVGLNHIYAIQQALKNRKRGLIPWMMPQVITVFPFARALQAPATRTPVFYVDHSDTAAHLADPGSREIHLAYLRLRGKDRELAATSGASVFNFRPGLSAHVEIPLRVTALSDTVFTIQPEQSLRDGEYIIVLGPVAASGFEFEINCLGKSGAPVPRIDAESGKVK